MDINFKFTTLRSDWRGQTLSHILESISPIQSLYKTVFQSSTEIKKFWNKKHGFIKVWSNILEME